MVRSVRKLGRALERLSGLLDDEHDCIVQMRYGELLDLLAKKRQVQSMLENELESLKLDGERKGTTDVADLARQVAQKSQRNEKLVRTSLRMVGEVLNLLYSHRQGLGQYDSKGLTLVPVGNSTWHESA